MSPSSFRSWLFASVLTVVASGAAALDCTGELGDEDVRGDLNIAVACTLSGTEVHGDVTIFSGGSLTARDVRIRGDLTAQRADFADIADSRIDGTVRLEELVGDRSRFEETELRGNVWLTNNRSALELVENEIDGNVRVFFNRGGVSIFRNDIDGTLECVGNSPAPVGADNRISRRGRGQCERLQPGGSPEPPPTEPPPPNDGPDVTPPKLTLLGPQTVSILIDSTYTDAGASAMDNVDGDVTSRVVTESNVDTKTLGIYTVTYSVSDLAGNAATAVSRTVNVTPQPTVQEGPGGGGALGSELAALLLLAAARAYSSLRRVLSRSRS